MRLGIGVWFCFFCSFAIAKEIGAPALQQVAEQALRYARLEPGAIREWEKKVRKSALLPRFQFGFERRVKNGVDVNVEDSVAVNSSGITIGPAQSKQVQTGDNDFNFDIKAIWYLDQLLFSRDHLDISQEARYLSLERERILSQVRQFYFQRERGLKELKLLKQSGATSIAKELKELEIAEAIAGLDNLTGGWFSAQIQGRP